MLSTGLVNASATAWASPGKVAEVAAGVRTEANAIWWGFDKQDATRFLQAALDSGAERVVIPDMGEPWRVKPLFVNRDDLEIVFGDGVVIEAKKDGFRGRGDCLLSVIDRRNIVLSGYGAVFLMHKEDYMAPPYQPAEWRHALAIRGSANVAVLGLTLRGAGGDGIYLGTTSGQRHVKDIVIRDVVCDSNARQGLSVISAENLLVERSVFRNTGGLAPGAGIDLEPNKVGERMVNVVIRDSFFENNVMGMHMWFNHLKEDSEPVSVLWENNVVDGCGIGIHVGHVEDDGAGGEVMFRNNTVKNTRHAGIHFRNKSSKAMKFVFENTVLINTATAGGRSLGARSAPVILHARTDQSQSPGGIELGNLRVEGPDESDAAKGRQGPVVHIGASSADWNVVWTDVGGEIVSSDSSRQGIQVSRAQKENVTLQVINP